MADHSFNMDAHALAEMATRAETVGAAKANLAPSSRSLRCHRSNIFASTRLGHRESPQPVPHGEVA
jgi:hypothetical protein